MARYEGRHTSVEKTLLGCNPSVGILSVRLGRAVQRRWLRTHSAETNPADWPRGGAVRFDHAFAALNRD